MEIYHTIYKGGDGEIVEKKSRFIAEVHPVTSEEEAMEILEQTRKQYWDARHHCWAYIIGRNPAAERMSDDGEPAGTAGKPILEVIRGRELTNVLVIVTRYFGGTLLGTGGLVRAYTAATIEGLKNSESIARIHGVKLGIETNYTDLGAPRRRAAQSPTRTSTSTAARTARRRKLWRLKSLASPARLQASDRRSLKATPRYARCGLAPR